MPEPANLRRKSIGLLMRRARETAGRTRKECAAFANIAPSLLEKYEQGERDPSLVELELLAHYLRVPVQSLLDADVATPLTAPCVNFDVRVVSQLRTNIIGTRLKQARLRTNRSVDDLANASGISAALLNAYELGKKPLPITELEQLLSSLDLTLDTLLDIGVGPLGEAQLLQKRYAELDALPEDVRAFVTTPEALPYLKVALNLSRLPQDELRSMGRVLLELGTMQ